MNCINFKNCYIPWLRNRGIELWICGSITDDAIVKIKEGNNCVVEGMDRIPRVITDCSYNVNDTVLITYKAQRPAIEKHEIKQWFV